MPPTPTTSFVATTGMVVATKDRWRRCNPGVFRDEGFFPGTRTRGRVAARFLDSRTRMLRITPLETDSHRCELRVEGRLAGKSSVEILREEIEQASSSERRVVLELSGVSFADQQAVALLAEAAQRGVVLVGSSAWLTSLLSGVGS